MNTGFKIGDKVKCIKKYYKCSYNKVGIIVGHNTIHNGVYVDMSHHFTPILFNLSEIELIEQNEINEIDWV